MTMWEEKPWMGPDKKPFLLLTHTLTAKERRQFLLVAGSGAGTLEGNPEFWLSAFGLFTSNNRHRGTEPFPPNVDPNN